jgi:hypothetical protein
MRRQKPAANEGRVDVLEVGHCLPRARTVEPAEGRGFGDARRLLESQDGDLAIRALDARGNPARREPIDNLDPIVRSQGAGRVRVLAHGHRIGWI